MRTIKISAVQFSLKPIKSFSEFEEQIISGIRHAEGSDFVVFPELFTFELLTTFPDSRNFTAKDKQRTSNFTNRYFDLFSRLARQNNQHIVAGSHLKREGINYYNSCFLFGPDGTVFDTVTIIPDTTPLKSPKRNKFWNVISEIIILYSIFFGSIF